VSFAEAVRSVLSSYATFSGRARRSEFWWFALFMLLVGIVTGILDAVLGTRAGDSGIGIINLVASLALLLPNLAVSVRRLHDTGRSGWWILIGLIPVIGTITLLVFFVIDSQQGSNKYGESPKAQEATVPLGGGLNPQA
jgi:uncharacterized membrane protein YhaH (DUF805 family)